MYNLFSSNLMKLKKSLAVKLLFLATCVMSLVTALSSLSYVDSPYANSLEITFAGYDAFFVSLRDTPTLTILCVILVGIIICGDFDNRTLQTSVCAGHSRLSILVSKCAVLFLAITIMILPYPFGRAIMQGILMGFGPPVSPAVILHMLASYLTVMAVCFSLTSIGVFFAFTVRKTIIVMAASIVLLLLGTNALLSFGISVPALGAFLSHTPIGLGKSLYLAEYAPSALLQATVISLVFASVFVGLTYLLFRRAELE